MEILFHISEAAKPADLRRINERTGQPVAGYSPEAGPAGPFFHRSAKRKSQDIVKARCRRWKRESGVRNAIIDFGPLVTDGREDLEATDMHENREGYWD